MSFGPESKEDPARGSYAVQIFGNDANTLTAYIPFIIVGIAFGATWTIFPSTLCAWYGRKNCAVFYNIGTLCYVTSTKLVSSIVGAEYDHEKKKHPLTDKNYVGGDFSFTAAWESGVETLMHPFGVPVTNASHNPMEGQDPASAAKGEVEMQHLDGNSDAIPWMIR